MRLDEIEPAVRKIVEDVRDNGDAALVSYAQKFDGLDSVSITAGHRVRNENRVEACSRFASKRFANGCEEHSPVLRLAKAKAMDEISPRDFSGQLIRPLDSVGCYVPGGRFPLVSTLLMTVIPAQVAGVKNIRVVSPRPSSEVLAAAAMLGVREFYRVGGAQAVAALAYGTPIISRVDKIVGPGNLYVTTAKKLVAFDCSIDMLAGPTEVVIVSAKEIRRSSRLI